MCRTRPAIRRATIVPYALVLALASVARGGDVPGTSSPNRSRPDGPPPDAVAAGPWKAWAVVVGNPQARALRGTTTIHRQGPADAAPRVVWRADRPSTPTLRLHESGWLVLEAGWPRGPKAVAPDSTEARERPDLLSASPPSRFVRGGFFAIGRSPGAAWGADFAFAAFMKTPPRVELSPATRLIRVLDTGAGDGIENVTLLTIDEPDATYIAWSLPLDGGRTRLGIARLPLAGEPALILDRPFLSPPTRTISELTRVGDRLRLRVGDDVLDVDPGRSPIPDPAAAPALADAVDRLLTSETGDDARKAAAEVASAKSQGTEALAARLAALPLDDAGWDRVAAAAPELLAAVLPRWWSAVAAPAACSKTWAERCRTNAVGGRGGSAFHEAPPCNTVLVGLRVTETTFAGHRILASIQALYDCGGAPLAGEVFGRPVGTPKTIEAPAGYSLGALYVRSGARVDGLRPVWLRRRVDFSFDLDGMRLGPWVGGHGGGAPQRLGSGNPIVGLHGRAGLELDALGLVEEVPGPEADRATVRVAAIQCPSILGDVEKNRARLTTLVERAAAGGAKIIVLPETSVTGYLSQDLLANWRVPGRPLASAFTTGVDPRDAAETVPGPSTRHFAALAQRHRAWITVPLVEVAELSSDAPQSRRGPSARYFNTVVLVSPSGTIAAHYRKLHPWPHPEQSWATEGDKGLAIAETEYGRVGLAICFDVHTVLPQYAAAGIWTLLYPIAWVSDDDAAKWFDRELPRRAKTAGFNIIGANWSVDAPQPWHGYGHSVVISKYGAVMGKARTRVGDEIVFADLSRAK